MQSILSFILALRLAACATAPTAPAAPADSLDGIAEDHLRRQLANGEKEEG
jgi:hypothetical protein